MCIISPFYSLMTWYETKCKTSKNNCLNLFQVRRHLVISNNNNCYCTKFSIGLCNVFRFSNLFTGNAKTKKLPSASIHYNAPATHLQPVGDPNKPRRLQELSSGDKAKAYDFLQEDA